MAFEWSYHEYDPKIRYPGNSFGAKLLYDPLPSIIEPLRKSRDIPLGMQHTVSQVNGKIKEKEIQGVRSSADDSQRGSSNVPQSLGEVMIAGSRLPSSSCESVNWWLGPSPLFLVLHESWLKIFINFVF